MWTPLRDAMVDGVMIPDTESRATQQQGMQRTLQISLFLHTCSGHLVNIAVFAQFVSGNLLNIDVCG